MFVWTKGENPSINEHFNAHEFACQCSYNDCCTQQISMDLIDRLTQIREALGEPIRITSGYRCHKHQLDLTSQGLETANGLSQHEVGMAADIQCRDMHGLLQECKKHFNSIGVANSFIHVDMRPLKADGSPRWWSYKRS